MEKRFFSRSNLIFLGIVALAFALRSLYFNQTIDYLQPGSGSDSYFYLQWAKEIVRGNIIGKDVFYALPAYPYFLSLTYLFSGGETFGLILIQIILGSINCGLIYILGKRLFNARVGIIAAIIVSGYFMFIFYDRMLLPASLAIFLGLIFILSFLKIRDKPSRKLWIATGFLLGLATLAKASYSILSIFILFWIMFSYKKSLKQLILYSLCFIAPFFLVISAVTLRNYLVAGDPVLITAHSGINFYIGNNPRASGLLKTPPYMRSTQSGLIEDAKILAEKIDGRRLKASEASNFWIRRSLKFIRSQPLNYLRLLGKKFILFWNGKEYVDDIEYYIFNEERGVFKFAPFRFSLISPLAILGMILTWPGRMKVAPLYIFVFALMLGTVFFFVNSRYRLIVVPYLIIFSAEGIWQLFQKFKSREYKHFALLVVLFFGLYFLTNIRITDASSHKGFTFHYNKGVYLSDRKEFQQAKEEFSAALKLNPYDFMSYFGLGNVYFQIDDLDKAIKNYKTVLSINPYFYNAHFNLGLVYYEKEQYEKAGREFRKVLNLKPGDCAAHYNLGRVYQEKGQIDLALKEYRQAFKIQPENQEILQAIEEIKR